jgi:hypothetical protein
MDRLHGIGNAVVPQIPEIIGRAIMTAGPAREREHYLKRNVKAEAKASGNLYRSHEGWPGCSDQDCLSACDTSQGHCERLRLWIEAALPATQRGSKS